MARGWCRRHYARMHRKGTLEARSWERQGTCTVDGCDEPAVSGGLCEMHRWRLREHGDPGPAQPVKPHTRKSREKCLVEGCERLRKGALYCHLHSERLRRTGEVGPAQPTRVRGVVKPTKDGYRRIHLPDGRRVLEHVHVMEQRLGRPLVPPENVHHKNGIGHDNDRFCPVCVDVEFPQELVAAMLQCASCGTRVKPNLELWLKMQPSGQRVSDLMEYIAEYHAEAMLAMLGRLGGLMAARYATTTFVAQLASGANHLVLQGSLRDSAHPVVVSYAALFTTSAPVTGKDVDGKMAQRLAAYPAGSEF